MTEARAGLLQAVLDAPDAVEPRLVLADWLMERGEPRGEFISLQCALADRPGRSSRREYTGRAAELLRQHAGAWLAPVAPLQPKKRHRTGWDPSPFRVDGAEFRLGFVDRVVADAGALGEHGEALWRVEPVRELEVVGATMKAVAALARQPFLERVRRLILRGRVGDRGARALAASPHLGKLERLNLAGTQIGDDGAAALAGSAVLRCRMLALTGNPIGDDGIAALAASPVLAGVERLYLARTGITDAGVAALASSPHAGALRQLGLGSLGDLGDRGARALVDSRWLVNLRTVEIDGCYDVSRRARKALATRFARVKT